MENASIEDTDFTKRLERFAEVTVRVGLNLQQGQPLFIFAPIEAAPFVRMVMRKAYAAGASDVEVDWADDACTRLRFECAPESAFDEFPEWRVKQADHVIDRDGAVLEVYATDPDLLAGIDPNRIAKAMKVQRQALVRMQEAMTKMQVSWLIVSVPTQPWADKVFPEIAADDRVGRLWEAILDTSRIVGDDTIAAWQDHIQELDERAAYLNSLRLAKLHYRSSETNLSIELPDGHVWVSAGHTKTSGVTIVPNIPTEEVFTAPKRDGVNGVVRSTRPLNYGGVLIDDFTLTFEDGRIKGCTAKSGLETLQQLIESDDGAHYLGEVSLVPHNSPISQLGILFYNTLFDENASCHLAIGNAISVCIEGGTEMTKDELTANGANYSLTHVDFMMGSADLDIDGFTHDGRVIPIFKQGNWATTVGL